MRLNCYRTRFLNRLSRARNSVQDWEAPQSEDYQNGDGLIPAQGICRSLEYCPSRTLLLAHRSSPVRLLVTRTATFPAVQALRAPTAMIRTTRVGCPLPRMPISPRYQTIRGLISDRNCRIYDCKSGIGRRSPAARSNQFWSTVGGIGKTDFRV